MKNNRTFMLLCVFILVNLCGGNMVFAEEVSSTDISGVIGLRPVEENSCIAVWIPMQEGQVLTGILWYNNDESIAFPEILLESGTLGKPVTLSECLTVAENVEGLSLGWSEIQFNTPVACLSDGLYILFRFPEGSEYTEGGIGGGAGLGYTTSGSGYPGWISGNGQDWVGFCGEVGFAVQPVYSESSEPEVVLKSGSDDLSGPTVVTALFPATPNPFNPSTTLKFSLKNESFVELSIFNIAGQVVGNLISERYPAGQHEVNWTGRDDRGRKVASGVYFAKFSSGDVVNTTKLSLIK